MSAKSHVSKLPARPNLDHLRKQAKKLLSKRRAPDFRLADALLAVAREQGFASWPRLARHVDALRALEGAWAFDGLEIDGAPVPAPSTARLLIDGDRFRMESPEGVYEGIFNIDVEETPAQIDIEFVEGPEAGNWSYGIFKFDGDTLTFCLGLTGSPRPARFATKPGSGHALERLRRASAARPVNVTGGTRRAGPEGRDRQEGLAGQKSAFKLTRSALLDNLQGEWTPVSLVTNGAPLQESLLAYGSRTLDGNEAKVIFGGQTMMHALVRVDEEASPVSIDYLNIGTGPRVVSLGILEWSGDEVRFCIAKPGDPRPADFTCAAGSGRTLSQWRKK